MKKFIIFLFIIVTILLFKTSEYIVIPNEAVRFRVISSTNNAEDIYMKEILTKEIVPLLEYVNEESDINESVPKIDKKVKEVFKKYNYNEEYKINYGKNYFPKKIYKDVLYNDGYYKSLVITIGKGSGSNFWCVLFPPLCKMEITDETKDVKYKFKVKEIIDKFLNKI